MPNDWQFRPQSHTPPHVHDIDSCVAGAHPPDGFARLFMPMGPCADVLSSPVAKEIS